MKPMAVIVAGIACSLSGADVPKWSGTLFGEISAPLGAHTGNLVYRVDAYRQSEMPFSNTAATVSPNTTLPAYTLVNMRLSWTQLMGSRLAAAVYARNLRKLS